MRFKEIIFSDLAKQTGLDAIHIKALPSVVALVGKNGAGKTRFLNCLKSMRLSIDIESQRFASLPLDTLLKLKSHIIDKWGSGYIADRDKLLEYLYGIDFSLDDFHVRGKYGYLDKKETFKIIDYSLRKFIKTINTDSIQELSMLSTDEADEKLLSRFNSDVKAFEDLLKYNVIDVDKGELQIIQSCGYNYIRNLSNLVIHEDLKFRRDPNKAKESPANIIFARMNYFLDMFLRKTFDFDVDITPRGKNFESNPQLLLAGRPFLHAELSPGEKILLTIALLFFVLDQNINFPLRECIILIDEPESHLHPDVQIRLIKGIKEIIEKKGQLFIATHSIELLSSLDRTERFLLKDGAYQKQKSLRDPSFYQTTYDEVFELLGFEGQHAALQDYLSSPAYEIFGNFIKQCTTLPSANDSCKNDDPQLDLIIKTLIRESPLSLLDFGAGKGRIAKSIANMDINSSNILYHAYEQDTHYHEELNQIPLIKKIFRTKEDLVLNKFNCILMCNVLHEIAPNKWMDTFSTCYQSLEDNGFLLLIEDMSLSIGELPNQFGYIIPNENAIKTIFSLNEMPLVYKIPGPKYKERILFVFLRKEQLKGCEISGVINAIKLIQNNALVEIKSIRDQSLKDQKMTPYFGSRLAFHSQHYINCMLSLEYFDSIQS